MDSRSSDHEEIQDETCYIMADGSATPSRELPPQVHDQLQQTLTERPYGHAGEREADEVAGRGRAQLPRHAPRRPADEWELKRLGEMRCERLQIDGFRQRTVGLHFLERSPVCPAARETGGGAMGVQRVLGN